MNFAATYREEVLASRRDRSRRAFFWARVVSLLLMLTIAATLRAEPQLRRALADAGMDAVAGVMQLGTTENVPIAVSPSRITHKAARTDNPAGARPLTPDIKVNRYGAKDPSQAIEMQQNLRNAQHFGLSRP